MSAYTSLNWEIIPIYIDNFEVLKMINNSIYKSAMIASLMASSLLVAGCGTSTESALASAGTTTVNKGVITGFGSIYVNGIKFETGGSSFEIDNTVETSQANLRVGMVVTINGTINADGKTGQATFIQYDNELKGPISLVTDIDVITKEITVLGRIVTVTTDTVFDDDNDLTFATLAAGVTVEISGLVTASGVMATHIEQQNDSNSDGKTEVLGAISGITGSSLDGLAFKVYGFAVSTDGATEFDGLQLADMQDGVFIEVKGVLDAAGTTLIASKIEAKKKGLGKDDIDEAEIEGLVSNYNVDVSTFDIQGQAVDASSATLFPDSLVLVDGITLEAEGPIVDGVLKAEKIKQKGNKIKVTASISAIDLDNETISFDFNGTEIVVRVNAQTEMEDLNENRITIADLAVGDVVKIKAFNDGTSTINAYGLEISESTEVGVEAAIEAFDAVNNKLTVLGVEFDLTNSSFGSSPIGPDFFDQLSIGEFVEIKDINSDEVIDTIELDD